MRKSVGVKVYGILEWHAPGVVNDYDTLCGLDANDSGIGTDGAIEPSAGQKITCAQCKSIWEEVQALQLKASDFA